MWNLSHELEISSIRWVVLWYFSVTLKSEVRMEATKYYFLDFAHKEAGVSSFLDALASLDFKFSVSESVIYRFFQ